MRELETSSIPEMGQTAADTVPRLFPTAELYSLYRENTISPFPLLSPVSDVATVTCLPPGPISGQLSLAPADCSVQRRASALEGRCPTSSLISFTAGSMNFSHLRRVDQGGPRRGCSERRSRP